MASIAFLPLPGIELEKRKELQKRKQQEVDARVQREKKYDDLVKVGLVCISLAAGACLRSLARRKI